MKIFNKLFLFLLLFASFSYGQRFDDGSVDGPKTTAQIQAYATPVVGQTLYSTDTNTDWQWNGTTWVDTGSGGGGSDGVVTNAVMSGNNLDFTGTGGGFNGLVDLSQFLDGSTYTAGNGLDLTGPEFSVDTGDAIFDQWDKDDNDDFKHDGSVAATGDFVLGGFDISDVGSIFLSAGDVGYGAATLTTFSSGILLGNTEASGQEIRLLNTGEVVLTSLSGVGDRMVVAKNTGELTTQTIPSGGGTDDQTAAEVTYDNSGSTLAAANVKAALDELDADVLINNTNTITNSSNIATNTSNIPAKASQAEAEAGTDDTKYMTPLKVDDAINANALTGSDLGTTVASQEDLDDLANANTGDETDATIKATLAGGTGLTDAHLADDGISPSKLDADNAPSDDADLTYESSTQKFVYATNRIKSDITGYPGAIEAHNIIFAPEASADTYAADPNLAVLITDKKDIKVAKIYLGAKGADIEVGTSDEILPFFSAITITEVAAFMETAPTGSDAVFDINEDGVSILSTKITIEAGDNWSSDASAQPVISDSAVDLNSLMSYDTDQIGSTVAGTDVVILFKYYYNSP